MDYSILYEPLRSMLCAVRLELLHKGSVPDLEIAWEFRPQFKNRKYRGDFSTFSVVKNVNRHNKHKGTSHSATKYAKEVVALASAALEELAGCSVLEEPLAAVQGMSCSNGYIHFYVSK